MTRPANKENHASSNDLVAVPASLKGLATISDRASTLKHKGSHAIVSAWKDQHKVAAVSSVSDEDLENIPTAENLGNLVSKAKTAIKRKCTEMGIGKHTASEVRDQAKRTKKRDAMASSVWVSSAPADRVQSEIRQKSSSRKIRNIELASDATMIVLPSEDIFDQESRGFGAIGSSRSSRFSCIADDNILESQITAIAPSSPLPFIHSNDDDDFFGRYEEAGYTADNTLVNIDELDVEDLFGSLDGYAPSANVDANRTEISFVEKTDSILSKTLSTTESAESVLIADPATKSAETGAAADKANSVAADGIDSRLARASNEEEYTPSPIIEPSTPAASVGIPSDCTVAATPIILVGTPSSCSNAETPVVDQYASAFSQDDSDCAEYAESATEPCARVCKAPLYSKHDSLFREHIDLLLDLEQKYNQNIGSGLSRHPKLADHMRPILVDWLCETAADHRLHRQTLHLAVQFLDRFLTHCERTVKPKQLQCFATACLTLAIKVEEKDSPSMKHFTDCADGAFHYDELKKSEREVLQTLSWHMSVPTMFDFLTMAFQCAALELPGTFADLDLPAKLDPECLIKETPATIPRQFYARSFVMACDIGDVLLHHQPSQHFLSSELAAACFYITAEHLGGISDSTFEECTGYSAEAVWMAIEHTRAVLKYVYPKDAHLMGSVQCCKTKGRFAKNLTFIAPDQLWAYQVHHSHLMDEFVNAQQRDPEGIVV
ncbi:G1/S-specific cyclin-E1 [Coemansia erecta]|uniref:G1/S-specific cyclin-E1 n=1 Tax=Coemansia erecta TaxID=147472 RepID=A0A9W7XZ25_9FUNG|nr:G1/S-specific cyclin-E1 [Coemansia erecta]